MLKIERRLIGFVEKHMFLVGAVILSFLALYLRKIAVWWNYGGVNAYFDMHTNYTQTSVYFLIVRLLQYIPILPIHSVKWLAGLADFGVAGFLVYMMGNEADNRKRLIFYATTVYSPVLFLRGIIWAQLDSVAILLLLIGYVMYDRRQSENRKAGIGFAYIPVIFAFSLCPCLFPIVIFCLWKKAKGRQEFWPGAVFMVLGGSFYRAYALC